jgi:hypothetical protein
MGVSKMTAWSNPKLSRVAISVSGVKLSETVSSVGPGAHERVKGNGFRRNTWKDIKGMGWDDVREVRDYSNAVPHIRSLV